MECRRCGFENAEGLRFCGSCGAPLDVPERPRHEERKLVSALFCDVVGSTERAAALDPEDVRRLIEPYHAAARGEVLRFGGTLEKFVGDAVFALFGAPQAQGDDAARAVYAALAIRDAIADLNEAEPRRDLHFRIGIATGEAVVELDARPEEGEVMAWGDALNTASRLQSAAPVDAILVDEATYRATRDVIEYGVAEPVQVKGKAEALLVWHAAARRSRVGVALSQAGREPLVDRVEELALLGSALDRTAEERTVELVTLAGVPGIGKSRLVLELFRRVELGQALITWRQGRCFPHGGVSYWALGEVVKGQAGILESDGASTASEKLARAVRDLVPVPADAARIEADLRSLVGLARAAGHGDERQAAFAAWRHFLEALARRGPLVVVFEDIHWDDGLADFVDHVLGWTRDVPLLLVCTARPELLELRPQWRQADERRHLLLLSPLSEADTGDLVTKLSGGAIPEQAATAVVDAAAGNPLYAVEFVRMLEDRALLRAARGRSLPAATLPVPQSIHGLIAARIDSLDAEEKALLQAAAVVGRVVWPGALVAIDGRPRRQVERALEKLEQKEFLFRARPSSVAREREYRFRHVLVRDVAYAQIPRPRRGESHRRAAEWLESLSPDRVSDRAEMLAHHYQTALELLGGRGVDTSQLRESARLALRDAGERAMSQYAFAAAARYFRSAVELWPAEDPGRASLLFRLGKASYYCEMEGAELLAEAEVGLLEAGDREEAAEAGHLLAMLLHQRGEPPERVFEQLDRAAALLDGLPASASKAEALLDRANILGLVAKPEQAIRVARDALTVAKALTLRDLQARALALIGVSRGLSGDLGGRADLERSIAIVEEIDSPLASHHCGILADLESSLGNLERCFELQERGRRHAERFGHEGHIRWFQAERVAECYWRGRWDEAVACADDFLTRTRSGSPHFMESYCRGMLGRIRLARGDVTAALEEGAEALRQARASSEPQFLYPALAFRARALAASEALALAAQVADELLSLWAPKRRLFPASAWVVDLGLALEAVGRVDELLEAAEGVPHGGLWLEAARAFADADFAEAARLFGRIGSRPDEAVAYTRLARQLAAAGREDEARTALELGLAFFREVGAHAYLDEARALVPGSP